MPKPPFPHMMDGDVPLFASFVLTPNGRRFTKWEFDTQVGPGHLTRSEFDPFHAQTAYDQSRLRIDAVGWLDGIPWIFEVRPQAMVGAIGNVTAYRFYYQREKFITPQVAIISDWFRPYMVEACAGLGIYTFTVGEASFDELMAACLIVQADCSQLIRIPTL